MELIQYTVKDGDRKIAEQILSLEHTAWPRSGAGETFPSAPKTYVASLVLIHEDMAICHVGIRKCRLLHRGQKYNVYGLSEVVTHPIFREQGIGSEMIRKLRILSSVSRRISVFLPVKRGELLSTSEAAGNLPEEPVS